MAGEIVTLKDVWDKLQDVVEGVSDIQRTTAVMNEQLRTVTDAKTDHEQRIREAEKICESVKDAPKRLTDLERKVWAIPSATLFVSIIALAITFWKSFH